MKEEKECKSVLGAKEFEELEYSDDFMFCRVMEDPNLCRDVIERLLQEKIGELRIVQAQKEYRFTSDGKPIRLDIYTEDISAVYDAEMQNKNHQSLETLALPRRSRFYQSSIDMDHIKKRGAYRSLPNSKVLFVCTFDPFKHGLGQYTFRERCDEMPEFVLGDGTEKYFFNCKYKGNALPESLLRFFEYVETGVPSDDLTRRIAGAVNMGRRNEEWKSEYIREWVLLNEAREDWRAEMRDEIRAEVKEENYSERDAIKISEMLLSGKTAEQISDFCGYPIEQVREVEKGILTSAT